MHSGSNMLNYEKYNVGDKFCLHGNNECFYTISDTPTTVTALAEWNLNVGNKNPNVTSGIQHESVRGTRDDGGIMYGNLAFSSGSYWVENNELKTKYGSYYAFVFDDNSNLWQPVQDYQLYLRNILGKTSVVTTLFSYNQAIKLGCNRSDYTCASAPDFVTLTSYWLGSAFNNTRIWHIGSNKSLYVSVTSESKKNGIRPVITIDKSEID